MLHRITVYHIHYLHMEIYLRKHNIYKLIDLKLKCMISCEASSSCLMRHMKRLPADFSRVHLSSPVVQRHEGCV